MHPALSVIVFTCLSGVGFGMIAWLGLGVVAWPEEGAGFVAAAIFALALSVTGLLSSTLHLGHPERAWRALSQWRSSWLSREGVLALLCLTCFSAFGLWQWLWSPAPLWLGWLCSALALLVVYATAMIYASLRTVARWHDALTPACYLAFAIASGLLALNVLLSYHQLSAPTMSTVATILLAGAWALKLLWWWHTDSKAGPSSVASATGLGAMGEVKLLFSPHSSENYLQQEMGFRVARKRARALRRIAITFGLLLPLSLLLMSPPTSWMAAALALLALILGLLVERWLFFAEAKHSVMLYYEQ